MTDTTTSDAQAIIELALKRTPAEELSTGAVYLVTDADGERRVVDTDAWALAPRWTSRAVTFRDVDSFAAYLLKHYDRDALEVWANVEGRILTAVLDAPQGPTEPRRCAHIARLALEHTPEWFAWAGASGKLMGQAEFAEFIEDRGADIRTPAPATMLELAQTFQAKTRVNFESATFLADGRRALEYREDVEARAGAKGQIEIPATFELGLRVFTRGEPYRIFARLRYRMSNGALSIGFKLTAPDDVVRSAVDDVVDALTPQLPDDVYVWHGKPSA